MFCSTYGWFSPRCHLDLSIAVRYWISGRRRYCCRLRKQLPQTSLGRTLVYELSATNIFQAISRPSRLRVGTLANAISLLYCLLSRMVAWTV